MATEWTNNDTALSGVNELALKNNDNNTPGDDKPERLNGWTSHRAVKVISFILIVALFVLILNRFVVILVRDMQTRISPQIVFDRREPVRTVQDDQEFFDRQISNALRQIWNIRDGTTTAARTRAVEALAATPGLRFFISIPYEVHIHQPPTPQGAPWGELPPLPTGETPRIYVAEGSGVGITEFRQIEHSNTDRADIGYFIDYPVFFLLNDEWINASHHLHNLFTNIPRGMVIFLAFEDEVVYAARVDFYAVRSAYIFDFTVIAVAAALMLFLFIVLLVGAGRRFGHTRGTVHFLTIDRPYLDIGLAVVIGWSALTVAVALQVYNAFGRGSNYVNITAYTLLFAVSSAIAGPPVLLWFMSLAKRAKAGRFWRHTLIFALPAGLGRKIIKTAKSLWSGFNLTLKVAAISAGALFTLLFVGIVGFASRWNAIGVILSALIATGVVTFLLLRYTRRLHELEVYAGKVGGGEYAAQISVGGGELGRIADSISGISAGINTAVEQRMKSERLRTELITNVSHDIRTPLTSIITYTDLLKNEGLDCEKAHDYLDVLIQKSARLKTLTDELFEAAKASSGNIEVNITPLDLVSLINQVLGELDGAIKSSGLDLRVDLPERLIVRADGRLLWRVMENLLSNVFKYALPGSRVYLSACQIDAQTVLIELKNISATELNIDPSELTERFKRGDDSRADGGSGLGLSIVQSFVTAQGGKFVISIDGDLFKAAVYLPPAEPLDED